MEKIFLRDLCGYLMTPWSLKPCRHCNSRLVETSLLALHKLSSQRLANRLVVGHIILEVRIFLIFMMNIVQIRTRQWNECSNLGTVWSVLTFIHLWIVAGNVFIFYPIRINPANLKGFVCCIQRRRLSFTVKEFPKTRKKKNEKNITEIIYK